MHELPSKSLNHTGSRTHYRHADPAPTCQYHPGTVHYLFVEQTMCGTVWTVLAGYYPKSLSTVLLTHDSRAHKLTQSHVRMSIAGRKWRLSSSACRKCPSILPSCQLCRCHTDHDHSPEHNPSPAQGQDQMPSSLLGPNSANFEGPFSFGGLQAARQQAQVYCTIALSISYQYPVLCCLTFDSCPPGLQIPIHH